MIAKLDAYCRSKTEVQNFNSRHLAGNWRRPSLRSPLRCPFSQFLVLSFTPNENIWPHLWNTVLPGYIWRTLGLLIGVGILTFIFGTATAWLVTMREFPLRRVLQWACLMPLAMPTYIVSYTYVDFLNYAGPLQTWLRGVAGWTSPSDYRFPEIRSLPGAILRAFARSLSLCVHDSAGEFPAPTHEPA